ncbi:SPT2 chromatin protein-domain-containing protein [Syncephalastrum racemosum]|uniref:SPT2 chromatin protein-domain-containing protein n=1 Tax=Syncephalastrum racemosum TaxID=13706 RepID=A0A1X2HHW6_SYNRA|nr:SPT2 chromatin protein-domain-containing protein [Syncephalastrum racemosum]
MDASLDQLMARVTKVASAQDASFAERAREKRRREEEERRKAQIAEYRRQQEERMQAQQNPAKRKTASSTSNKKTPSQAQKRSRNVGKPSPGVDSAAPVRKALKNKDFELPMARKRQESERAAQLSFEELMRKAREVNTPRSASATSASPSVSPGPNTSTSKPNVGQKRPPSVTSATSLSGKRPPPPAPSSSPSLTASSRGPNIYQKRMTGPAHKSDSPAPKGNVSARDMVRQMFREPPQRLNAVKRDRRGVTEIQRDLRHAKGIYSDDEDDVKRSDPRLMKRETTRPVQGQRPLGRPLPPSKPIRSTMNRPNAVRPLSRPSPQQERPAMASKSLPGRPGARVPPRMPFTRADRPLQRDAPLRRSKYEEELDPELADFVVSDEEEEEAYDPRHSYSDEISKIFGYDKKRYRDETFSDDDMEVNTRDLIREEKRSERIGRREDLEEERRELERLKRLKASKGKVRT